MVMIKGRVPTKEGRGRRRMNRVNNIIAWIEKCLEDIHRSARNKEMLTGRSLTMAGNRIEL